MLKELGKSHVKYGVLPKHYSIVGQALITCLQVGLKNSWNPTLEAAWLSIYQIVQDTMISDHYENFGESQNELTLENISQV